MDLSTLKVLAALFIFLIGLLGALIARRMMTGDTTRPAIGIANCFAGGVFLAAGLIHVLPDSQDDLATACPSLDYPLFGLLACGSLAAMIVIDQIGHSAMRRRGRSDQIRTSAISAGVLFLILSIHSIITGISLGIEPAGVAAMALLLAVLAHKGTAAFALGLKVREVTPGGSMYIRQMVGFALTTPLGVLIGLYLMLQLPESDSALFEGIFDAIAAGTFLYVAVFEILADEFKEAQQVTWKSIAMGAGIALMAVVAIWT